MPYRKNLNPEGRVSLDRLRELTHQLDEVEGLYHALVAHAPFGILIHNGERVQFINPAGARLLGGHTEDIVGAPISRFIPHDELAEIEGRLDRVVSDAAVSPLTEQEIYRLDGVLIGAKIMGLPVRLQNRISAQILIIDDNLLSAAQTASEAHIEGTKHEPGSRLGEVITVMENPSEQHPLL